MGKEMKQLTEKQIRDDNPHFGPIITILESRPYKSKDFDFDYLIVVGSKDSCMPYGNHRFDAKASYLWSSSKNVWILGAN